MSLTFPQPIDNARLSSDVARVMICDDSAVIRAALTRMLETDPQIRVVSRVADGSAALAYLTKSPGTIDVVVLDIEMPVMDGITALPLLLKADPGLRVIMASTLTTRGADIALRALRLGAADYVPKPATSAIADDSFRRELAAKVKGLARLRRRAGSPSTVHPQSPLRPRPPARPTPRLLAIGSSTGGPQALFTLIQGLGKNIPVPVILTQHMPAAFTSILAEHLTRLGAMPCTEAKDGDRLHPGQIILAPGNFHLMIEADGPGFRARLSTSPPENYCRPSVDPMLRSAVTASAGRVLMVMLTGMGHDGREATRALIAAGGAAIAQDEETSIVWGMPGAIAQAGLCEHILPLGDIAGHVLDRLKAARA